MIKSSKLAKISSSLPHQVLIKSLRRANRLLGQALIVNARNRQQVEETLKVTQTRLSQIVDTTSDALLVLTSDGNVCFANPAAESLFGRPHDQLLEHNLGIPQRTEKITEISIFQPDGTCLIAEMRVSEILWDDEIAVLASLRDITEHHQAKQQLLHQAFHDSLTQLPNRSLFLDRLEHALQRQRRYKQSSIVVLFLDIDHFKLINDSFGHLIGDKLLQAFATRLQSSLRESDTLARLGGDEFAILLEETSSSEEALKIAERVQKVLLQSFQVEGQDLFVKISIGIALDAHEYAKPEQLLRDADTAMYRAKAMGRDRYVIFEPAMHQQVMGRLQKEKELRQAVEREELVVYYQPIVSLQSGTLKGFEALVRWQHPQHGLLLPGQFMPLAEEMGLIVTIDRWVLAEACAHLKQLQNQHLDLANLTVNVNLSSQHFSDTTLPDYITKTLETSGLDARDLKLELTETGLIENLKQAQDLLDKMCAMHVQLCLDDFGTGYSSLSYLHHFPVSCLKIDRSFVSHMQSGDGSWEIIRTIVALSKTLGLEIVAEGIETAHQWARLKQLGCDKGQGYFFCQPISAQAEFSRSFKVPPRLKATA